MTSMNIAQIKEIHIHNQNVTWKKAYDIAVTRFIDEGYTLAEAATMADDLMFKMNWTLSNPEEECYTE